MVQGQKVQQFLSLVLGIAGSHILSAILSRLVIEKQASSSAVN